MSAMLAQGVAAADNFKISGSYAFTDNALCSVPIRVAGSYDEMMHTFYDNAGDAFRMSFTGKVLVTYTNLATGATYSPNSSGPGRWIWRLVRPSLAVATARSLMRTATSSRQTAASS